MSADGALKKTETEQDVLVRAFQEDSILGGGGIVELVGEDKISGARATPDSNLSAKRHPTKGRAHAITPEGRALFPDDLTQHQYTVEQADGCLTKHYGIEYGAAALSVDPIYRKLWLEAKVKELCATPGKIPKISQ